MILTSFKSRSRAGRASDSMKSILCSTPAFLMIGNPISYDSQFKSIAVICSEELCQSMNHAISINLAQGFGGSTVFPLMPVVLTIRFCIK